MTIEINNGEGTITNNNAANATTTSTTVEEALAPLYAKRDQFNVIKTRLEKEIDSLKRGFVNYKNVDGSQVTLSLFGLPSPTEGPFLSEEQTKQLKEAQWRDLQTNPIAIAIHQSLQSRQELQQELTLNGELPALPGNDQPVKQAAVANRRLVVKVSRKSRSLARFIGSTWLVLVAVILFVVFYGQSLLYLFSGGSIGADSVPVTVRITPASSTVTVTANHTNTTTSNTGSADRPIATNNKTRSLSLAAYYSYRSYPLAAQTQAQTQIQTSQQETNPTNTTTATATATPSDNNSDATTTSSLDKQQTPGASTVTGADIGIIPSLPPARVGQRPEAAGGNNGPHGAFAPPSKLSVTAIGISAVTIARAQTEESADGQVNVIWPRPDQVQEVSQIGVYPGQLGNCVLMGNQSQLGLLRKAQIGDYLTLTDRSGNQYLYRFVEVSPAGLPEMIVDPTNTADSGWLFEQPGNLAEVTILVSIPQPQPPSLVAALSESSSASAATTDTSTSQMQLDDLATSKRLAYRAVLARYAPTTATPGGYAVEVPSSAWTPAAALARQAQEQQQAALPDATSTTTGNGNSSSNNPMATLTPAITSSNTVGTSEATTSATVAITTTTKQTTEPGQIPAMPDTGLGGSNNLSQFIGEQAGSMIYQLVPNRRQLPNSLTVMIRPQ